MKAFLQIRIIENEQDAMRFHWYKDLQNWVVEVLRFTRALFGIGPSPVLLEGVIRQHLESCRNRFTEETDEMLRSLYVDDLIGGGTAIVEAQKLKETATTIFHEAKFQMHKWHSNEALLETEKEPIGEEQSYGKTQLGVKAGEMKLLVCPGTKLMMRTPLSFGEAEF